MAQMAMYDTIKPYDLVGRIPVKGDAVAGYLGGNSWPDYHALVQLFPGAQHLSIGGRYTRSRCIDCESGFASIGDIRPWSDIADTSSGPMVLYTFASAMSAAIQEGRATGKPFLTWSAHFNFRPHICEPNVCGYPKVDATQWTDRALPGADADQTLIRDAGIFFPHSVPSIVPDPHNFNHFASSNPKTKGLHGGPFDLGGFGMLDERDRVLHYYGAYPHRAVYPEYMEILKGELTVLAGRLARVATVLDANPDGTANWDPKTFRGERFQRLIHMGQGGKPQ